MKPIGKGEKIVLDATNVLYVTSTQTASLDVIPHSGDSIMADTFLDKALQIWSND